MSIRRRIKRAAGGFDRQSGSHSEGTERARAPSRGRRSHDLPSSLASLSPAAGQSVFTQVAASRSVVVYRRKATPDAPFVWISDSSLDVVGFSNQSLVQNEDRWKGLLHRDYHETAKDILKLVRANDRYTWDYEILAADGDYRWIRDEMRLVRDEEGSPLEIVGCSLDLTPYKEKRPGYGNQRARSDFREIELVADLMVAQYRIRHQSVRHRDAVRALTQFTERLESSGARNLTLDPVDPSVPVELFDRLPGAAYRARIGDERVIEYVSLGFREVVGLGDKPVDPAARFSLTEFTHADVRESNNEQIKTAIEAGESYTLVYPIKTPAGVERWVWDHGRGFSASPTGEGDDATRVRSIYGFLADVTDSLSVADHLADPVGHEVVKSIVDDEEFDRHVADAIDSARGTNADHVVCVLDLKAVNKLSEAPSNVAQDAGAIVSGPVGDALRQRVRSSDVVARMTDREFALLMSNCSIDKGEQVARELLDDFSHLRIEHGEEVYGVDVQIGVAAVDETCDSARQMLDIARQASRTARMSTTDSVWARDTADAPREPVVETAPADDGIESIALLDDDRFCLFAQPGFNARVREAPAFYELLLRYRSIEGPLLLPERFLPVAERYGLLTRLDRWVIRNGVNVAAGGTMGRARAGVSINLSSEAMNDAQFPEFVCEEMDRAGIEPGRLTFELAEMDAVDDLDQAARFINDVKKYGCRFALDDFGSGSFSFSELKQMPVDAIKISGSLIRDAATSRVDRAMVAAIASVATEMGIKTVAKNVEDAAAANVLCDLGVDYLQGFALERPQAVAVMSGRG